MDWEKGEEPDYVNVMMEFQRERYYVHLLKARWLWKPNETSIGMCIDGYHPRIENLELLDRTTFGWLSRSAKNQR